MVLRLGQFLGFCVHLLNMEYITQSRRVFQYFWSLNFLPGKIKLIFFTYLYKPFSFLYCLSKTADTFKIIWFEGRDVRCNTIFAIHPVKAKLCWRKCNLLQAAYNFICKSVQPNQNFYVYFATSETNIIFYTNKPYASPEVKIFIISTIRGIFII